MGKVIFLGKTSNGNAKAESPSSNIGKSREIEPNLDDTKEQRKKGDGSIRRKAGSKNLYVGFSYFGEPILKSTHLPDTPGNRRQVEKWLERQLERIADGTFRFAKAFPGADEEEKKHFAELEGYEYKPEPHQILFGVYVEKWLEEIWSSYQSETKRRDFKQVIDDWLLPYFSKKTFYQISGVEIKRFISTLKKRTGKNEGKTLSRSRIRNILIPLRAIWSDACEDNRWDLPDPCRFARKHMPKGSHKHPEVFRFEEWLKLLEYIDPYYRIVAEVMIMTGMIGSEIAGLRKQDIQGNVIVIQNSIVRKHEKGELKTEYRKRNLPIAHELRKRLDAALSVAKGEYVFTMKSGRIFDVDSFRKNPWTSALKKAGISYKVPYATRHSFAAWALTVGMNPNRLVRLMGHNSKKMIYEVYGSYVEGLEKDAGQIKEYFGNDFNQI